MTKSIEHQTAVPGDRSTIGSGREASLNKLEQEIQDLMSANNQPATNVVPDNNNNNQGINPNLGGPSQNQHNQQLPYGGVDTSVEAVATSEEEKTYRKRFIDLKQYYDKTVGEQRQQISALEVTASNAAPQTQEELEAFKNKNPEMFATMESMLNNNNNGMTESRVAELETMLAKSRQETAMKDIQSKHSDFYEVVADPSWQAWVDKQPESVVSMVRGNTDNAQSFIRALDLYKFDKGGAANNTASTSNNTYNQPYQSSAADAVTNLGGVDGSTVGETSKRIWTRSEINKLSIAEYEMFKEDILVARNEGRIQDNLKKRTF